ncbi:aldehyde dehydrogenase family protein [Longimicrobium sp.]|uniref:aldehyde dehydrogenase family protein n=1 Tax=Longimicrobium sp. TaxID=2029185 RepID=UPI002E3663A9|nr:aldehyde dehydrogenase family protein [Longimicrobium sp.]HEX6042514.1 aldehyde dehydrogenase family protein [Longimicrobium sp.]
MSIAEIFETMEYGPAPESASPAVRWLEERGRTFRHFIGGEWREPSGGEFFDTDNPATNKPLARIAQGTREDVDAAVRAAREALPAWQALDGHGRARYLYALARHIQRHARLFAVLETMDNGKPIRESRDIDIPLVARHFYHHAGWAQLMETELPGHVGVGVIGQIIPWNFPLLMLAWKIAPALAMGNTVVLKPAEFTSLTALLFAEVCRDAGLPPGVVNVVTGDGRTGAAIVEHPDVDKIAFTGSTDVGRIIRVATAGSGKKLSLELGGKSPFIVFDDADLDSVVEGVVDAIWFNQGQVCCAGSRILAQEGIVDKLVARLRERMETLRVGDPLDKAVDIGAIVAPVQLEKITQLVNQGREEGATLWQPSWSCPQEGCFFPPTLFTDVAPSSTVAQVEIFGPVVVLMTFRTPSEAVALANNTPYGLAASVWTESLNLALDVAPKVLAGTVWVNSTNLFDAAAGFGGYRESGFGREGGKEGLWEYVKPRWEVEGKNGGAVRGRDDRKTKPAKADKARGNGAGPSLPPIDRTAKLYIGGKQARPDSGYAMPVYGAGDRLVGDVGLGNRKDVRNAVEAAHKARGWSRGTAHTRAQVIYYLAENLAARADEFTRRIAQLTGDEAGAEREVEASIRRLYTYGAWADKYDGQVHATPLRNVTIAMNEPIGVVSVACPDAAPLLGFVSAVIPAVAMGNAVVAVPSERWPLVATDFYQVLDTSDVPGGVINIVTGKRDELAETLASHDDVDALWYFGGAEGSTMVERLSAGNMKRTWVSYGRERDWFDGEQGEGREFLRQATHVKNIWVPYGE